MNDLIQKLDTEQEREELCKVIDKIYACKFIDAEGHDIKMCDHFDQLVEYAWAKAFTLKAGKPKSYDHETVKKYLRYV